MCLVSWYSSGTEKATKPKATASMASFSPIPCQRALFEAAHVQGRAAITAGHAWLTSWVAEAEMLQSPGGAPNADAIYGALGLIGVREAALSAAANDALDLAANYTDRWAERSTSGASAYLSAPRCEVDASQRWRAATQSVGSPLRRP